jgi:hypothetical protein
MTTRGYLLTTSATFVFVAVLTYTGTSFAQVNQSTFCSTNTPTVQVNQNALFTASGGNGSYSWTADNFSSITNTSGSQFSASFPSSGTYNVRVTSNGQTGYCTVTVVPNSDSNYNSYNYTNGTLACLPSSQSVSTGQTAYFNASGGNGSYSWIVPELSLNNPTGTGSYVTYMTPGTRTITVTSGGASATCSVTVVGNSVVPQIITVPGLPNTGGGYGKW